MKASAIAGGILLLLAEELVRTLVPRDKEPLVDESPCFIDAFSGGRVFLALTVILSRRGEFPYGSLVGVNTFLDLTLLDIGVCLGVPVAIEPL